MNVFTPEEMSRLEKKAFQQGLSEEACMEEAGTAVARIVKNHVVTPNKAILILAGKGNNAGDSFVAGWHLLKAGFKVAAYLVFPEATLTSLAEKNFQRFIAAGGEVIPQLTLIDFSAIIDGIFGTGFKGIVSESLVGLFTIVNHSKIPIFSIDIPSGVNGHDGSVETTAIIAHTTICLEYPKLGCFLGNGWSHIGNLEIAPIGLQPYIKETSPFEFLTLHHIKHLLPALQRTRNKYQAGYVVGVAGSKEMPGAALLSSLAALKSGAGMMRLFCAAETLPLLVASAPEIIKNVIDFAVSDGNLHEKANAQFIGPGISRDPSLGAFIERNFQLNKELPTVVDADALYFLSQKKFSLPIHSILTPHQGEMGRLLETKPPKLTTLSWLHQCQEYASLTQSIIVLKGSPTFIITPGEKIYISCFGDPGMATAGSGDVLTGFLSGLLAQGLSTIEAAQVGVSIHGLAGELAAKDVSSYAMTASDLLNHLGKAFLTIQQLE